MRNHMYYSTLTVMCTLLKTSTCSDSGVALARTDNLTSVQADVLPV